MKRLTRVASLAVLMGGSLLLAREPAATRRVGEQEGTSIVVPTNQLIRPAGQNVDFAGRPVDVCLSPSGKFAYFKGDSTLIVVDAAKWQIVQELKYPSEGGSMYGLAISRDGRKIYTGGSGSTLFPGDIADDGTVKWGKGITIASRPPEVQPGAEIEGAQSKTEKKKRGSYPCGVTLSADDKTAFVCLSINNTVGIIDLAAGKMTDEVPVGVAPFAVVLSPDGKTAYVSNWGGRRAKAGDKTASSAGTPTVVDARGVAASGTVGVIDLNAKKQVAEIAVGLHPAGMVLTKDGSTLYVANANSDTVSVIDTATRKVRENILVRPDATLPFGSASNALALSPDEKTLFVANGGNNAIAVVDVSAAGGGKVQGFIPAGWYPGGVATDGKQLFIANIKGIGSRDQAKVKTGWASRMYRGTVTRVDVPDAATLAKYTEQVRADARVPESLAAFERAGTGVQPVAIPKRAGEPSLIEHVVYVIKENRTYDQVFGDMPRGNSDPKLCTFGREVTPNHHALADQFVLLDNFYCNGVLSADGHQWAMEGAVVDGLEKSFGGFARSYPFSGDDPLAFASTGFIWDNALLHGRSFRNYGEMGTASLPPKANFDQILQDWRTNQNKITYKLTTANESLRRYTHPEYPGWNLTIPDVVRARIFLKEFKKFEAEGKLPNLMTVFLPSDHTKGVSAGAPTPAAMVADNDLALGQIVEAISKSKFWPKTAIFVIEDDPQAGFDHVDGHRSPCLVISPYVKRGALVSNFYNQTSVLHTMELILGLPPMNQMDAMAPVMRECFTDKADVTPYTALPNKIPLDQMNKKAPEKTAAAKFEQLSDAQRWDIPDAVSEDALNRIIWFAQRGEEKYPAEWAGAHGKGLKKLNLSLTEKAKKGKDDDDDD